jgi:hypothetical protein
MQSARRAPLTSALVSLAMIMPCWALTARADAPAQVARVQTIQSIGDALGDSEWPQGDITAAAAAADADGTTTVSVSVQSFDSPFSDSWQFGITGIIWEFDVDHDGAPDFGVTLYGIDDTVLADVSQVVGAGDVVVCDATPSWDAALRSYTAALDTACLGNPVDFRWRATMAYEHVDTEVLLRDIAPDAGWSGPVANDAHPDNHPACTPGVVGPAGPPADGFVSLVPSRILDTRVGMPTIDCLFEGGGRMGGTTEVQLSVAGRGGVPLNATAVVLNLTATEAIQPGFVTVYPCGTTKPNASNLNYLPNQTVANAVIADIGPDGKVCLFSNARTHVIADVNGYFTAASTFVPTQPPRRYDSRGAGTTPALPAGSVVPISSPDASSSLVMNVTVVAADTSGYATAYPCGSTRPVASNLNFGAGDVVANTVIAKTGAQGNVCLYLSADAHLVVDTFGFFPPQAGFTTVLPARLLETRSGLATVDGDANGVGLLPGQTVLAVQVAGRGGVPANASAVVLNVTVDQAGAAGFISVFPCGSTQPLASNLNYPAGGTVPNAVIAKIGAGGKVCFFSNAATHLVVDVNAFFPAS